jgi:hypothetical protein
MNETFRRKYAVTLEEEDLLFKRVDEMMLDVIEAHHEERMRTAVQQLMDTRTMDSGVHEVVYRVSFNDGGLVGLLGEIRRKRQPRAAGGRFSKKVGGKG